MHQTARTGADSLGEEGHRNDSEPPAQWIIRPPASGLRVKAGCDSDLKETPEGSAGATQISFLH